MTIFLTTHFLDEAEYCHRVALIAAATKLAEGTPTQLKQKVGDRVLLEVRADDPAAAREALRKLELVEDVQIFGAGVHVAARRGVEKGDALGGVAEALRKAGVKAGEPEEIPPTLEDVFLRLTSEVRT
jgi:ABC-2 type transport system ATP-binding protein